MKFKIEPSNSTEHRKLFYVSDDYSFDIDPSVVEIDYEIIVNKLALTVVGNKIVALWGFCPYGAWIKSTYDVPKYAKGTLKVLDKLEPGFSYAINKEDWPIYVNVPRGWVCVGNPTAPGGGVEFIDNCVAVISDGELVSLWLKPESLPAI